MRVFYISKLPSLMTLCLLWAVPHLALAQTFDSGSDGSLGELTVNVDTEVALPPDGVLHYTTVTVNQGATLSFLKNAANTPVYLLATGDVVVAGEITVSALNGGSSQTRLAGPGGFNGGVQGFVDAGLLPGAGQGPGGGQPSADGSSRGGGGNYAGCFTYSSTGSGCRGWENLGFGQTGSPYGSPTLLPLVGGSGGAGNNSYEGGGGGGALLLASNTRITLSGTLSANPGYDYSGSGSGGGIRMVAPEISGNGSMSAGPIQHSGGDGRCRIDTFNRSLSLDISFSGCAFSYGSLMLARLLDAPTLTITAVGDKTVNTGADGAPVTLIFPVDTNPNQNVTIAGTGFSGETAIKVLLFPESGPRREFAGSLSDGSATVSVTFPVNIATQVMVVNASSN